MAEHEDQDLSVIRGHFGSNFHIEITPDDVFIVDQKTGDRHSYDPWIQEHKVENALPDGVGSRKPSRVASLKTFDASEKGPPSPVRQFPGSKANTLIL